MIHALQEGTFILRGIRDFLKWNAEHDATQEKARRDHSFKVLIVLVVFLGLLVALMAWLVLDGKVSGDALLFMVGTVAGWIMFTVQRYLFRAEPTEDESVLSNLL